MRDARELRVEPLRGTWRITFDEPPDLLVERGGRYGQQALFPPGFCPAPSVAGSGRPADGPIKPFFVLLYAHRHRRILLPERVTEGWLFDNHLAPNNEGRFMHTLQFVGLIRGDGEPVYDRWHLNQRDPAALYRTLMEVGYGDLEAALRERPSWHTVDEWMRARLDGSAQMVQRRIGFYQHLRLAAHLGIQGYDGLMRAARETDRDALLPQVSARGPKLVVVKSVPLPPARLRVPVDRRAPAAEQLSLRYAPMLEVVEGGLSASGG